MTQSNTLTLGRILSPSVTSPFLPYDECIQALEPWGVKSLTRVKLASILANAKKVGRKVGSDNSLIIHKDRLLLVKGGKGVSKEAEGVEIGSVRLANPVKFTLRDSLPINVIEAAYQWEDDFNNRISRQLGNVRASHFRDVVYELILSSLPTINLMPGHGKIVGGVCEGLHVLSDMYLEDERFRNFQRLSDFMELNNWGRIEIFPELEVDGEFCPGLALTGQNVKGVKEEAAKRFLRLFEEAIDPTTNKRKSTRLRELKELSIDIQSYKEALSMKVDDFEEAIAKAIGEIDVTAEEAKVRKAQRREEQFGKSVMAKWEANFTLMAPAIEAGALTKEAVLDIFIKTVGLDPEDSKWFKPFATTEEDVQENVDGVIDEVKSLLKSATDTGKASSNSLGLSLTYQKKTYCAKVGNKTIEGKSRNKVLSEIVEALA